MISKVNKSTIQTNPVLQVQVPSDKDITRVMKQFQGFRTESTVTGQGEVTHHLVREYKGFKGVVQRAFLAGRLVTIMVFTGGVPVLFSKAFVARRCSEIEGVLRGRRVADLHVKMPGTVPPPSEKEKEVSKEADTLRTKVTGLETELQRLREAGKRGGDHETRIRELEGLLAEARKQIPPVLPNPDLTLQSEIERLRAEVDEAKRKQKEAEAAAQNQHTSQDELTKRLDAELAVLKGERDTLKKQLEASSTGTDLQSQVNQLTLTNAELDAENTRTANEISEVKGKLAEWQSAFSTVKDTQNKLEEQAAKIRELEKKLQDLAAEKKPAGSTPKKRGWFKGN